MFSKTQNTLKKTPAKQRLVGTQNCPPRGTLQRKQEPDKETSRQQKLVLTGRQLLQCNKLTMTDAQAKLTSNLTASGQ
jgi:hypothetical protein